MKLPIIYTLGPADTYSARKDIDLDKRGKWLDLDGWKPRITSIVWGAATPELLAEAKIINVAQKALSAQRKALNAKLLASQAALLEAAAKAPRTVKAKVEPLPPLTLNDDLV